jgi:hypothetical protein
MPDVSPKEEPKLFPFAANIFHPNVEVQALTMVLDGQVQGVNGRILFDSGATCNVISAAFAKEHHIAVTAKKPADKLQVANGSVVEHLGFANVEATIQGQRLPAINCAVLDMSSDWCLLLGQEWLRKARAVISYADLTIRGYSRKGRPFVLRCAESKPVAGSDCQNLSVLVLSAIQAKRLVRKGCKVLGYGHSAYHVRSRQVVRGQSYSSCSPYDCLLSIIHNCWTRLASGNAQHLSQPVPLHHCLVHKHQSSN